MCKTLGVSNATPSHLLTFRFQCFFASVIQGFPTSFGWLIHAFCNQFLQSLLVFFPSHDVVIWVACPGFFCLLQEHFSIFLIVPLLTSTIPLFDFFARQRHDFNIWKIFFLTAQHSRLFCAMSGPLSLLVVPGSVRKDVRHDVANLFWQVHHQVVDLPGHTCRWGVFGVLVVLHDPD